MDFKLIKESSCLIVATFFLLLITSCSNKITPRYDSKELFNNNKIYKPNKL